MKSAAIALASLSLLLNGAGVGFSTPAKAALPFCEEQGIRQANTSPYSNTSDEYWAVVAVWVEACENGYPRPTGGEAPCQRDGAFCAGQAWWR